MSDLQYLRTLGELLGGQENRFVRQGLALAAHDRGEIPRVEYHFLNAIKKSGRDILNLPKFPVPRALPQEGMNVGEVMDGDRAFGPLIIPLPALSVTTGVFGASGTGKSTLIKCGLVPQLIHSGLKVIVFDPEDEYAAVLCRIFPNDILKALTPQQMKMNPALPPPEKTGEEWRMILSGILKRAYFMGDGMQSLFLDVMTFVHSNYSSPTFFHVWERLKSISFRPTERHYGFLESLRSRFRTIMAAFGKTFDCAEGFMKKDILGFSLIVREAGLDMVNANFFDFLLLERMRWAYGESEELKVVAIFEEAHLKFGAGQQKGFMENSEQLSTTHIRTLRKRGFGLMFLDQVPSLLPNQLLANLGSFFIFRQVNPNCIRRLGDSIGLSQEQRDAVAMLANRQYIFFSHLC